MNRLLESLTKSETKVLSSLSKGRLYKEVASDLEVSINTVKKHLKNIYRKLDVKKRRDAVAVYKDEMAPKPAEAMVEG